MNVTIDVVFSYYFLSKWPKTPSRRSTWSWVLRKKKNGLIWMYVVMNNPHFVFPGTPVHPSRSFFLFLDLCCFITPIKNRCHYWCVLYCNCCYYKERGSVEKNIRKGERKWDILRLFGGPYCVDWNHQYLPKWNTTLPVVVVVVKVVVVVVVVRYGLDRRVLKRTWGLINSIYRNNT